jgi:hypothetical protein
MLISLLLFHSFKDRFESLLLPIVMYTALIAALVGFYDSGALILGLPRIFPTRASGEILSGFRNAGQAGAYFLVIITILYPLRFSRLYQELSPFHKRLLNISLLVSLIFLALSGKIAAYIGVFIGFLGYAIMKRNGKTIFALSSLAVAIIILFINLESFAPRIYERIVYKYENRLSTKLRGDVDEGDFLMNNLDRSIEAFTDRPLTGSGLGAFIGPYGDHEVHSTYFKMFGEAGIIGALGYAIFVLAIVKLFKVKKDRKNPYMDYLKMMIPFIIGCFVSWGYTYHLRKREFWLLVAIILIIVYKSYKKNVGEKSTIESIK